MGDCISREQSAIEKEEEAWKWYREFHRFRGKDPVDEKANATGSTEDSKRTDNIPRNKL